MFSITTDKKLKLVHVVLSGFLTIEEVNAFAKAEEEAIEAMGLDVGGEYYLLLDTTRIVIQSQEVIAHLYQLTMGSKYKAKRVAVARADALTRTQTKRVFRDRQNVCQFENLGAARRWLLSDDPAPPFDGTT